MENENQEELSARDILQKIRDGSISPTTLSKETRQSCVEALLFEGYQQSTIAQFLKKSDRTIRRDMDDIRKNYNIKPNAELSEKLVADFVLKARIHHAHLMRLARTPESSVSEKSRAEALAWKVNKEMFDKLYLIGLLVVSKEFPEEKEPAILSVPISDKKANLLKQCETLTPIARDILIDRLKDAILKEAKEEEEREKQQNQ